MPRSVNEILADDIVSHDVDLMRLTAKSRRTLVRSLNALQADLIEEVRRMDMAGAARASTRHARLLKLIESADNMVISTYKDMRGTLKSDLRDIAEITSEAAAGALEDGLTLTTQAVSLTPVQLTSIAGAAVVEGAPMKEWMGRQSARFRNGFKDQMRMGLLAGESVPRMVRRIRPLTTAAKHEVTALVRTSALSVQNEARVTMYGENDDLIKAVQASATLDTKTSQLCRGRDKMSWTMEGVPIKSSGANFPFPGPPPWHFNCRTTLLPITKSFEELGIKTKRKVKEIDEKRAAMDGEIVSAKMNYEAWLRRQPAARAREALGNTRYKLWKRGKGLTMQQMLDQDGRPLSVEKLRAKYKRKVRKGT